MKKLLTICAVAFTASAADWYVAPNGTGGGMSPSDRGDAMDVLYNGQVASGDTIHFAVGTYNLDINKIPAGSDYGAYLRVPDGISSLTLVGETGDPEDVRLVGNPSDKKRIIYFNHGGNVIRDILVSGGCTDYQGAGICMADSYAGNAEAAFAASNCVVENCSAAYQGANFGGLWRNCVIRNNEVRNKTPTPSSGVTTSNVEGSGGGIFHATLYDCVVTNNVAGFCGGGIAGSVEYIPLAVNSFWRIGTVDNQTGCVSGEDKDPKFKGVTPSDLPTVVVGFAPSAFAIKAKSPCLDKGVTFAWQIGTTDLLGNPRVKNGIVDLGALEFDGDLGNTIFIR